MSRPSRPGEVHIVDSLENWVPLCPDRLTVVASSPYHRHRIRRAVSRFVAKGRLVRIRQTNRVVGWKADHKTVILNDNWLCRIKQVDS